MKHSILAVSIICSIASYGLMYALDQALKAQPVPIEIEDIPEEFSNVFLNNYYRGLEEEKNSTVVIDLLAKQKEDEPKEEDLKEVAHLPYDQALALMYKVIFNSTTYTVREKQNLINAFVKRKDVEEQDKIDLQFIKEFYLEQAPTPILQGLLNNAGNSLLFNAAQQGRSSLLYMLFDYGLTVLDYDITAIVNIIGKTPSRNPAHLGMRDLTTIAITNNNPKVVEVLLDYDAGIETHTIEGYTPLIEATISNKPAIVALLLERGANTEATDKTGWSPLHIATAHGYIEIINLLLNADVDINQPTVLQETPLHIAVRNGQIEAIRLLIRRGASLEEQNMLGDTPLETAQRIVVEDQEIQKEKMEEIIKLLEGK